MLTAAIVVVILITPNLLKSWGIAAGDALAANSLATLGLIGGCLGYGVLADRLGATRVLLPGALLLAAMVELFFRATHADPALLAPLYALTGIACGVVAVIPVLMVRSFPTAVRFTGLSFAYNSAYALAGGITPLLVAGLAHRDALAPGHYVAGVAVLGALLAWAQARRELRSPPWLQGEAVQAG